MLISLYFVIRPKLGLLETMKYFEEKAKAQQPKKTFAVKQKVLTKPSTEELVKPMTKISNIYPHA